MSIYTSIFFLLCGLNSTWYVRLYVCSPHAPSSKQGQASSHSNHLTQLLIRTQSESGQSLFQSTEKQSTIFFSIYLAKEKRSGYVLDCEIELYFVCKCAISQNREMLNLNNTMVFFFLIITDCFQDILVWHFKRVAFSFKYCLALKLVFFQISMGDLLHNERHIYTNIHIYIYIG